MEGFLMKETNHILGFSLVEILVSLFVVSLAAVNISGLQKMVGDQIRDNFSHTVIIELVTEKFEQVMQADNMQDIIDLNGATSTFTSRGTLFTLLWRVGMVSGASATSPIREIEVAITWPDATGAAQTFKYSEQISLAMLLKGAGGADENNFSTLIPNLLETNDVNYFDPKMGYKKDAYILYDSQLFLATSVHSVGNGLQRDIDPPINTEGVVSGGWERLGRIDNVELANLFTN
jgi:Tfp pilus assembly protein PilV